MEVSLQFVGAAAAPLNVTVLDPCVAPKADPEIVTELPTSPNAGEIPDMVGGGITVNGIPLLACPLTVTTTFPVLAPSGTTVVICVALHVEDDATNPLNETVLAPCVVPKLDPEIVTCVPTGPEVGDSEVIVGAVATENGRPLLDRPLTVTTTFPVMAPAGTDAVIVVCDQLIGVAVTPLNLTELPVALDPKFVPEIVTVVPTGPELGDNKEMTGAGTTVNAT
jgi:hypothetical protein